MRLPRTDYNPAVNSCNNRVVCATLLRWVRNEAIRSLANRRSSNLSEHSIDSVETWDVQVQPGAVPMETFRTIQDLKAELAELSNLKADEMSMREVKSYRSSEARLAVTLSDNAQESDESMEMWFRFARARLNRLLSSYQSVYKKEKAAKQKEIALAIARANRVDAYFSSSDVNENQRIINDQIHENVWAAVEALQHEFDSLP